MTSVGTSDKGNNLPTTDTNLDTFPIVFKTLFWTVVVWEFLCLLNQHAGQPPSIWACSLMKLLFRVIGLKGSWGFLGSRGSKNRSERESKSDGYEKVSEVNDDLDSVPLQQHSLLSGQQKCISPPIRTMQSPPMSEIQSPSNQDNTVTPYVHQQGCQPLPCKCL